MKKTNRKAFTLVEIVIVIAVIGILAGVMIPVFGGIIDSANKASDQSTAANLSIALSQEIYGIKDEDDLNRVITETFSADFAASFAPKTADKGNHFWYDSITNTIVLKTFSEVVSESRALANSNNHSNGVISASAMTVGATTSDYYKAYKDSYRMFNGYYLLDRGGSAVGDAINAIETGTAVGEKIKALANIPGSKSKELKESAAALLGKLKEIAIVTNNGTYICAENINDVTTLFFAPNISTIGTVYLVNPSTGNTTQTTNIANNEKISGKTVAFPTIDVEKGIAVNQNSLMFDADKAVTLKTSLTTEQILNYFRADSTNAIIEDKAGNKYYIDGSSLYKTDDTFVGYLGYSVNVDDFTITANAEDGAKIHNIASSNVVYISYDELDKLNFTVGNFSSESGEKVSSEEVIWSTDNDQVSCEGGDIALNLNGGSLSSTTVKVTATAVAGGKEKTYTVNIVKVIGATVTLGGTNLEITKDTLQLVYNGTNKTMDFAATPTYNADEEVLSNVNCVATLSVTHGTGSLFTIENNKLTFNTSGDFSGTQTFTVKIGNYLEKTITVTVEDQSSDPFETKFNNPDDSNPNDKYTYRVGNGNAIRLDSLFVCENPPASFTLSIKNMYTGAPMGTTSATNAAAGAFGVDYTSSLGSGWESKTVKFVGTGVATLEITADNVTTKLTVEVVDGINVTTDSSMGNSESNYILLNNVSDNGFTLTNATLYGNGFNLDITSGSSKYHGIINLKNANLDNVRIIGAVYQSISGKYDTDNFSSAVYVSEGECSITNSFISGCSATVKLSDGKLLISDTTLYGGTLGNMEIRGGALTLNNVVTYNQSDDRGVVGLGIVIYNEAKAGTTITINGTLTQYNFINKDVINSFEGDAKTLATAVFSSDYAAYEFADGYRNMGIVSMSSFVAAEGIIDNRTNHGYDGMIATLLTFSGYVYSIKPADDKTNSNRDYSETSRDQAPYLPKFEFNLGNQELTYEGESDNHYCYIYTDDKGNSVLKIKYLDNVDPISLNLAEIVTISKYSGQKFSAIVFKVITPDGIEKTLTADEAKNYAFTQAGDYTLSFTITDNLIYDKDGKVSGNTKDQTYYYSVNVAKPAAKHQSASITVDSSKKGTHYYSKTGNIIDPNYGHAIPLLSALTITDYKKVVNDTTGQISYTEQKVSGADIISLITKVEVTGTINSGTIVFTLDDGRKLTITISGDSSCSMGADAKKLVVKKGDDGMLYALSSDGHNSKEYGTNHTIKITRFELTGYNTETVSSTTSLDFNYASKSSPGEKNHDYNYGLQTWFKAFNP